MNEILRRIQNLPEDRKARIVELFNKYDPATPGVDEYVSGQCIHNKAHLANPSPVKVVRYAKYEAALKRIAELEYELSRVQELSLRECGVGFVDLRVLQPTEPEAKP